MSALCPGCTVALSADRHLSSSSTSPTPPSSWYLCAIASLAEFPELIVGLFQQDSREISPSGRYNVLICEGGIWQNITVDDLIPCNPSSGRPAFASGHNNELWVMIMEKVYAKICGSYKATESGFPFEALIDLTGDELLNWGCL